MTPIETELNRVLNEAAPEPPEGSGPRKFGTVSRRRRSWVLPVAAAAAVLVIAAIAVAISRSHSHGSPAAQTNVTTSAPAPTAPAGMISVGYYGITVTVPKSFAVGPVVCYPPVRDTVDPYTGEAVSCPLMRGSPMPPRGITVVHLQPSSVSTGNIHADRPTSVDGVPARTGDGHASNHRPASVLVIPRNDVAVEVTAPTYSKTHRILQNVHIAPVDPHGCADRATALASSSNSPANTILPGKPVSAVACEYLPGYRLIGSGVLSSKFLRHAVDALDGANPGSTRYFRRLLFARYIFRYANGTERTIDADLDYDPFTATDGQHSVASSNMILPRAYR